jgi:hypothetical protein
MFGTEKSRPVRMATGAAENRMNGRNFPHRECVMSMMLPMTGSLTASRIFATPTIVAATPIASAVKCAYCERYSRMKVVTVVRIAFWPKAAVTMATLCVRADGIDALSIEVTVIRAPAGL